MRWQDVARRQGGVVCRRQLLELGLSSSQIGRMGTRGALRAVGHGVYLAGGAPNTFHARLWAAVLATDGILGYGTAGELWGITSERTALIHVVVPHARHVRSIDGVRLHRWRPRAVPIREMDGLPVTARAWTVLSMLGSAAPWEATRLADRALQRGWITTADLELRLRDFPGRHGNVQLRRIAALTVDGAAAESERRLHRILRRAGISDWVANYPLWVNGELVAVVDVALPARRIAIEIDGMAYHVDVDRFRRDRSRQNELVALGWTVLRFTWVDVSERPGYVLAMVRKAAA